MKLNFTSLEYFLKAAEMEHLTKAAEALHIAQPALSRTIRGLEEELNVTLFEKEGRNIRLTRDGHILLKYTENFLREYKAMQQELEDSRNLQQLKVNLSILLPPNSSPPSWRNSGKPIPKPYWKSSTPKCRPPPDMRISPSTPASITLMTTIQSPF